jgi:hypothetical protein
MEESSQEAIITKLAPNYPEWNQTPGALNKEQIINLAMALFQTNFHILTLSKAKSIEHWNSPNCIGGFILTSSKSNNGPLSTNHAWRILDCDSNKLKLMNPKTEGADIKNYNWKFMIKLRGTILMIDKEGDPKMFTPAFDPYR